jgi:hypothetical protein
VAAAKLRARARAPEDPRRFASTFDLLPDDEYRNGLARAEEVLPERIDYRSGWLIAIADAGHA